MKKFILTNSDNSVMEIANKIETKQDRYYIEEMNTEIFKDYPTQDMKGNITHNYITLFNVDVPDYVEPAKYCYTESRGFYVNEDYVEPPKPNEERLDDLETSTTEIELALADIYEEVINNG